MNAANTPQTLSRDQLEQVLSTFEVPTCPAMVLEVMQEARKDAPDMRRLATSISADVGMSAITLKMANSSLFRSGGPVDNVQRALDRLGTRNVLSVVLGVALRSSMMGLPNEFINYFWARSAALALAAGLIARRQYGISPDAAYTYAMFHDAAIPILLRRFPEYNNMVKDARARGETRMDAERQLPSTHPIIGALLVRNWGLPNIVGQAIRYHHEPDVYSIQDEGLSGGALSLIAVGHVAEYLLADIFREEEQEVSPEMFEAALSYLGINSDEKASLHELIETAVADAKR